MKIILKIYHFLIDSILWSGNIKSSVDVDEKFTLYPNKSLIDAEHKEFYMEFYIQNEYSDNIDVELSKIALDLNSCRIERETISHDFLKFTERGEREKIGYRAEFLKPCYRPVLR